MRLRTVLAVALLLMLAPRAAQAAETVLRKGNGPDVETLDPHKARSVSALNVLRDLYEGLVGEAPDGRLVPGAAQRWEVSADGRRYVFELRPSARWSNGDALTADDYVAGLRRSTDPRTASPSAQLLSPIENADAVLAGTQPPEALGVAALDPQHLEIRLKAPTAYFLQLLTHAAAYPLHRPSLEQFGARFARPEALVGNGAYRLQEWTLQSHVLLRRNPHYWNDAATRIDAVYHVSTEDLNAEFQRFRAGELDWTEQVPAARVREIRADTRHPLRAALQIHPYLGVYYYGFNLTRPPFRDAPALRRALSLAIDRRVVANKLMGSGEIPAHRWLPPGLTEGGEPDWAQWPRERQLAEARRLYAQAGYSDTRPLETEIRYNTHEYHEKIATVVAAMWKQFLGVRTQLINEESKVFLQTRRARRQTQVFRAAWIGDYADPTSFLELLLSSNPRNDTGYASTPYDELLRQSADEPDAGRRLQLLAGAERMLDTDAPVIPLYHYVSKRLVSPRLRGWQGNLLDHHYTMHMQLAPP